MIMEQSEDSTEQFKSPTLYSWKLRDVSNYSHTISGTTMSIVNDNVVTFYNNGQLVASFCGYISVVLQS
jgi:hypothetical protein